MKQYTDSERLDWLDESRPVTQSKINPRTGIRGFKIYHHGIWTDNHLSFRAAIDDAMNREAERTENE